jgi:hypothetical protein
MELSSSDGTLPPHHHVNTSYLSGRDTYRSTGALLAREIEETGLGVLFISHDWHLLQGWASDIFALEARAKGTGLHRI